jgi:hypothetical protein
MAAIYPYNIHSQVMSHRALSRNSASKRAMPADFVAALAAEKPYIPWHWTKNKKGMQEGEEFTDPNDIQECIDIWLSGRDQMLIMLRQMQKKGLSKNLCNAAMMPFCNVQTLITFRLEDFSNFLVQRKHGAAEPHMFDLADDISTALSQAEATEDCIHVPYITQEERDTRPMHEWAFVSATRCRRVSYYRLGQTTPPPWEDDLQQAQQMLNEDVMHWSPFEHQCMSGPNIPSRPQNLGEVGEPFAQFRGLLEGGLL